MGEPTFLEEVMPHFRGSHQMLLLGSYRLLGDLVDQHHAAADCCIQKYRCGVDVIPESARKEERELVQIHDLLADLSRPYLLGVVPKAQMNASGAALVLPINVQNEVHQRVFS